MSCDPSLLVLQQYHVQAMHVIGRIVSYIVVGAKTRQVLCKRCWGKVCYVQLPCSMCTKIPLILR